MALTVGTTKGPALSPLLFNIYVSDMRIFNRYPFLYTIRFAYDTDTSSKARVERDLSVIQRYVSKWTI